jgi:hypothetical protein
MEIALIVEREGGPIALSRKFGDLSKSKHEERKLARNESKINDFALAEILLIDTLVIVGATN